MKLALVVVLMVVVVAFLVRRATTSSAVPPLPTVRLGDVERVFRSVDATRRDGTFGVFLFGERDQQPAEMDALNVQFSVENGRVGLDWVLLSPLNVAARDRVVAFFEKHGSPLSPRSMNDVNYLRTEKGDLARLCKDMLSSVFAVADTQRMDLIAEGFEWKPQ
jgi:hypothetical protein